MLLDICGRRRDHERHFIANAYGNHVARDALAGPYSRIETRLNDIDERPVDRNIEADLGISRQKASNDGGKNEIGGRRRNGQAERASRPGPRKSFSESSAA